MIFLLRVTKKVHGVVPQFDNALKIFYCENYMEFITSCLIQRNACISKNSIIITVAQ